MPARLLLVSLLFLGAAVPSAGAPPVAPPPRPVDPLAKLHPKPPEPVPPEKLEAAIRAGVKFLVADQNKDGSFGSHQLKGGVQIYAWIGTFHAYSVATSSLSVSALIESGDTDPAVIKAIEKGEAYLLAEIPKARRDDPTLINNVWAHAYGIQALVRMHGRLPDDKERKKKIEALIREQFDKLAKYESVEGGWGYYDFDAGTQRPASSSTSFVNAAVLVAFHEAKSIGLDPPEKVLKRAIKMTEFQRQNDGTYLYGTYLKSSPVHPINLPGGSLGRSQACHLALRLWGDSQATDAVMTEWLDRLIVRNGWLSLGRKRPYPHESFFAVAGYFYYFGHYYAALAIHQLPAAERPFYQDHIAAILMDLQETDGSWWDYPLYNYHKPYGTGFAVMSLVACRKSKAK
jgi:hypothetical protein